MSGPTTVSFRTVMPDNDYFAIGFGSSMTNTDMILWQSNGANSKATDLWSTGHSTPTTDSD